MQVLATVLGWVLDKIVGFWEMIAKLAVAVFTAAVDFAHDLVCWTFDSVLGLAISIMGTFDFSGFSAYAGSWASLPVGTIEVLEAIGLTTALGLVVSAIGIRIVLQLVPFTRLGS